MAGWIQIKISLFTLAVAASKRGHAHAHTTTYIHTYTYPNTINGERKETVDEKEGTKRNVLASVQADSVPRQRQLGGGRGELGESGDIGGWEERFIPSDANIQGSPRGLFLIIVYYRDDVADWLRFALAVLFPRGV